MFNVDEGSRLDTEFAMNVVGTTQFPTIFVSGTITAEPAGTASKWQHALWFPHVTSSVSLYR